MKMRITALFRRCLLPLMGLLAVSIATADIYEWKDATKSRVYSDRPAPDAQRVNIPSKPTDSQAATQRAAADREHRAKLETQQEKQNSTVAATKTVEQDVAKTAAERCEKARKDYKTAIESQRLYRIGKNNQREYLNDAELTQARVNALKMLDDVCKNKTP